jgi:serine/threonine protein phosphatase PrpC
MNYNIFECSVVGYKNVLKNLNSQDYLDYKILDNAIICTVADGHSGEFFKYSDIGSKIACKCSIKILEELINMDEENILKLLENETIQRRIFDQWMDLVENDYKKNKPRVYKPQYLKYSTTLVSILITDKFRLYLKIGDGEIVIKSNDMYKSIIKTKYKQIVDSLGRDDSYKNIMYHIEKSSELKVDNIILFTDGYENSFENNEKLYKSLDSTIKKYNKNVFSKELLKIEYKDYLNNLSKYESHDDISIIFIM